MCSFCDLSLTGVDVPTPTETPPFAPPELCVLVPPLSLLPHPAMAKPPTATAAAITTGEDLLRMTLLRDRVKR
jgi:hypothetical protein